jgi:phosphoribosylformylglycinamidine cyclo-ligase
MTEPLSYKKSGVDIDAADAAKRAMAQSMQTADPRVLNRLGPFASLFDARFPDYREPVLVLKMEEPGSKQKLAFQHGRARSICYDLVNHLIDDIVVMGARPLAVLDCVVCGKLDPKTVPEIVGALADACREQDCTLVGGETSEQPGVVWPGIYILTASAVGVVERSRIIDGGKISEGDVVLAVASNGLHTNGYSLVRALIERQPGVLEEAVDGEPFLEVLLRPHTCYYKSVRGLFEMPGLHGMAHITGGGIGGNLNRVLPAGLDAQIDLGAIRVLPVFRFIRQAAGVEDADMLRTFNLGVGLTIVAAADAAPAVQAHLLEQGRECYPIGTIIKGEQQVAFSGTLRW